MAQATAHLLAKDLVLTKEQLDLKEYPSWPNSFIRKSDKRFQLCKFTKDEYKELSSSSKMFAINCQTSPRFPDGETKVLAICIVNENGMVIYKTMVKPYYNINDYPWVGPYWLPLWDFQSLQKATTTLDDVQKFIREQLPDDAILVGHSLNFDLMALKLIHPYIIDTAVVYNTSGDICHQIKLKDLAKKYLNYSFYSINEAVFDSKRHALVAMALVRVRIEKDPLSKG